MKGASAVLPLLVWVGVAAFVYYANLTVGKNLKIKKLPFSYCGIALSITVIAIFAAEFIHFPDVLQLTDGEVITAKESARTYCQKALAAGDEISAENYIRDNSVSHKRAGYFHDNARVTIERTLRRIFNPIIFGLLGVMYANLPLVGSLAVAVFGLDKRYGVSVNTSVILPITNVVTVMGCVSFLGFYLWMEGAQVSYCILMSGHWYTYSLTTLCMAVALAYVCLYDMYGMGVPYCAWFGAYQAICIAVLKATQHFYHDGEEARMGLFAAGAIAMTFVCPAALLTMYRTNGAFDGDGVAELFDIDFNDILERLTLAPQAALPPTQAARPSSRRASVAPETSEPFVPQTTSRRSQAAALSAPSTSRRSGRANMVKSESGGPPPPPPPPAGAPPPPSPPNKVPPPPPPASGGRADLLKEIQKSKKLRPVGDKKAAETPSKATRSTRSGGGSFNEELLKKVSSRRKAVAASDDEDGW